MGTVLDRGSALHEYTKRLLYCLRYHFSGEQLVHPLLVYMVIRLDVAAKVGTGHC